MRSARFILAGALWLAGACGASAYVEFGKPDFPNYLAPYGHGTCDWWTSAWLHACPGVLAAPAAVAPAAAATPAVVKVKKGRAAKPAQ
jgi:hypothetical protein